MGDNVGARIEKLIATLGIKKVRFAEQINIDQSFVTQITKGKRNPSDRTLGDICRVFGVRMEWLRDGTGPMFLEREPEPLDVLLQSREIPERDLAVVRSVVSAFLELGETSRKEVIRFVESCATKLNAPAADPAPDGDLAAKVDALERQNRELLARLEAIEKEDAETLGPVAKRESVTQSRSR